MFNIFFRSSRVVSPADEIEKMETSTHFLETGAGIFVRVGWGATDTVDNFRGEYSGCADEGGVVGGRLVGSPTALLGWQQLESAQPKKMVLWGDHLGCVALRQLVRRRTDGRRAHDVGRNARHDDWTFLNLLRRGDRRRWRVWSSIVRVVGWQLSARWHFGWQRALLHFVSLNVILLLGQSVMNGLLLFHELCLTGNRWITHWALVSIVQIELWVLAQAKCALNVGMSRGELWRLLLVAVAVIAERTERRFRALAVLREMHRRLVLAIPIADDRVDREANLGLRVRRHCHHWSRRHHSSFQLHFRFLRTKKSKKSFHSFSLSRGRISGFSFPYRAKLAHRSVGLSRMRN